MRARVIIGSLVLAIVLFAGARAEEDDDTLPTPVGPAVQDEGILPPAVSPRQIGAVTNGLAWLAENQDKDGSWGQATDANLAVTALAALAFMAQGNTESRGRFHANVREAVKFLLRCVTRAGESPNDSLRGYIHLKGDENSHMHAHGYATLALACAYGMGKKERRAEIRERLQDAIHLIESAQDDSGGWWYEPVPTDHEGSVTVCMVQALRTARDAGIRVNPVTVAKAIRYLERSHDPKTGGFAYSLSDPKRQSYGLTSAALSTLFGLGQYDREKMIRRGLDYLRDRFDENLQGRTPWFFYSNFYAAQTLWQAGASPWGEEYWDAWWPSMRTMLLNDQEMDGSWRPPRGRSARDLGPAYCTAFACLILEVPFQFAPLYER